MRQIALSTETSEVNNTTWIRTRVKMGNGMTKCLFIDILLKAMFLHLACPRGFTFTWWGCRGLCQKHKSTELSHSFLFCSCVCFCLYSPFNRISFPTFPRQLCAFSLCSSGLNSALLVLSTIYLFMKASLSPDIILCG